MYHHPPIHLSISIIHTRPSKCIPFLHPNSSLSIHPIQPSLHSLQYRSFISSIIHIFPGMCIHPHYLNDLLHSMTNFSATTSIGLLQRKHWYLSRVNKAERLCLSVSNGTGNHSYLLSAGAAVAAGLAERPVWADEGTAGRPIHKQQDMWLSRW